MIIGREQILTMIPHAGAMCLLDEVLRWDAVSIRCLSHRYRAAENPLRRRSGILGTACGIEIAAQAMAVHGRLTAGDAAAPASGYLVSLRDVRLTTARLDATNEDLLVDAERLLGDAKSAVYHFSLTVQGTELLSGRATVILAPSA
jgi:predicted hotdog family 3-hydroxylacyl-ACP dehydratase